MRQRLEHMFINGKPKGKLVSVEDLDYTDNGYTLSTLEKWQSAAIVSGLINVVLLLMWWSASH